MYIVPRKLNAATSLKITKLLVQLQFLKIKFTTRKHRDKYFLQCLIRCFETRQLWATSADQEQQICKSMLTSDQCDITLLTKSLLKQKFDVRFIKQETHISHLNNLSLQYLIQFLYLFQIYFKVNSKPLLDPRINLGANF